jgi:arsenate reductase
LLKLFGITSCDSCRKARKWLKENSHDAQYHDLRNDGLEIQTLERWMKVLDWQKFLNTRSLTWRKIPEVDRAGMTKDRAISLMIEHPTLVKRPVLECAEFVAVGFSPANYEKIFSEN